MTVTALCGEEQFHVGTATWCALAEICLHVAPTVCSVCKYWFTNDGDGLNEIASLELAKALEGCLAAGTIADIIKRNLDDANAWPDETCVSCKGTGVRTDSVGVKFGFDKKLIDEVDHPRAGQTGWCNRCTGRGTLRPYKTHYPLKDTLQVTDLILFLKKSGGFRIY
jgi:hypothetical protein